MLGFQRKTRKKQDPKDEKSGGRRGAQADKQTNKEMRHMKNKTFVNGYKTTWARITKSGPGKIITKKTQLSGNIRKCVVV